MHLNVSTIAAWTLCTVYNLHNIPSPETYWRPHTHTHHGKCKMLHFLQPAGENTKNKNTFPLKTERFCLFSQTNTISQHHRTTTTKPSRRRRLFRVHVIHTIYIISAVLLQFCKCDKYNRIKIKLSPSVWINEWRRI